jgi:hypothetical protein
MAQPFRGCALVKSGQARGAWGIGGIDRTHINRASQREFHRTFASMVTRQWPPSGRGEERSRSHTEATAGDRDHLAQMTWQTVRALVFRIGGQACSTSTTRTPQHWRERAQELRAIASELTIFSRAQESMFRIADHYERKAVRLRNDLE